MKLRYSAWLLCGAFSVAHAQSDARVETSTPERTTHFTVSAHGDALDKGYDDWRGMRLELGNETRGRIGGHVAVFEEQRFGTTDRGIELSASVPFGKAWVWVPTVSLAPDADFLARTAVDMDLYKELGQGWVASGGIGQSRYRDANVNRAKAGIERYVGAWRIGYQAIVSQVHGRSGVAHDLRVARSYADTSEVGIQFNAGREPTVLAQGIVNADVKGVGLFGHHAFNPTWTLWWNVGTTRQGDFYTRRGAGVGLQYRY